MAHRLKSYREKRDFRRTEEPKGGRSEDGPLRFAVQKHDASRLHYDLRLEWDDALLSWAVTKGPSGKPSEKRLAVRTEDHPVDYAGFEGTIPEGEYGAGTVMLWDEGTWEPRGDVAEGLKNGALKGLLRGRRMQGRWALIRMQGDEDQWLLVKEKDRYADEDPDALTDAFDSSVRSGRTMDEIAREAASEERGPGRVRPHRGKRPEFIGPQLATLVKQAPEGDDWLHETKLDGYRCLAALGRGGPVLHSRSGKDWSARFGALEGAFAPVPCASALIDGEVLAAADSGEGSAFSTLQETLSEGGALVFHAFDLLSLDGEDLTGMPQETRRARLEGLLEGLPLDGPLRLTAATRGDGPRTHASACAAGAEGIVSKRAEAPYRSSRTRDWLKVKCTRRQELVIGGYSPSGKPDRPFASLLLGDQGPDGLRYRGRVGTGFGEAEFETLTSRFHERETSPFADGVPDSVAREAVWLRPELVAEVDFTELTREGHVRHGAYLGLRDDKPAEEVTLETPQEERAEVAGIRITHPGRLIFPETGCTKRQLAEHYGRVGARMADTAGRRPLALLRCPGGIAEECFYQKHARKGFPAALSRVGIEEKDGETRDYFYATRRESFVAAAQMGTVEFHIWGARTDRLDRPDRLVFDLDPGEGAGWDEVRSLAFEMRGRLEDLGLAAAALVTGGKGVHVWVPLRRTVGWDEMGDFAEALARRMARETPDRLTASPRKAAREGKVFIDWLRNRRGATSIAPYSVRARQGAPVALPVTWDELKGLKAANRFGMDAAAERLEDACPWLQALDDLQTLTKAAREAVAGDG
ncbi:MAG: DNA ligase D [Paracoccaceae bacterium]